MEKEVKKTNQEKKPLNMISNRTKIVIAGVFGILIIGGIIATQVCCDKSDNKKTPVADATKKTAQVQNKKEDTVIAVALIGNEKVSIQELEKFKNSIPEVKDMPMDVNLYNGLLSLYLRNRVLLDAAKKAKIENDPDVKKALEETRKEILRNAYLAQKIKEKATNENLVAYYNKLMEAYVPEEEIRARHILVETEKQAKDLIVKLKAGAKFEELASKYSKHDNTKNNGGDLGYFKKTQIQVLLPEFANVAFAIKAGQISEKPVKTHLGWHVIKVEDRRVAAKPTFDQVKEEVELRFAKEIQPAIIAEEMQKAQVTVYDALGLNRRAQQEAAAKQQAQQQAAQPTAQPQVAKPVAAQQQPQRK